MDESENNKGKWQIWVAIIGSAGLIIVAILNHFLNPPAPNPPPAPYSYTGIVRNHSDRQAVKDAQVFVSEDQSVPEQMRTDSDGIFHTKLSSKTESVQLWVVQNGYETYRIQVKPNRTGMQEIELEPLKPFSAARAQTKQLSPVLKRPTDGNTTSAEAKLVVNASSIPPVSPDSLSNETLRGLANDIANKLTEQWIRQIEDDKDYKEGTLRASMSGASEDTKRAIGRVRDERRQKFEKDNVGLLSDGNFLLDAMRPRIGPMPEEWRRARFTIEDLDPGILKEMAKRLGP